MAVCAYDKGFGLACCPFSGAAASFRLAAGDLHGVMCRGEHEEPIVAGVLPELRGAGVRSRAT
jgi:hypothetical protein